MNDFIKSVKGCFSGKRGRILLLLFLLGAVLLTVSFFIPSAEASESGGGGLSEYKRSLEAELCEMCKNVEGVGKCRVMISFSEGERLEYKGGELISAVPPRVLGVSILCEGAGSDAVRAELTEMVSALFGIGKNRICILKIS